MPTATKKDLDTLLKFLNADIGSMEGEDLIALIQELASFYSVEGIHPIAIEFTKHYERLAGNIGFESSQEAVQDRKRFLTELQSHARARIEEIISISKAEKRGVVMEILGKVGVVVENDRFWEEIWGDLQTSDPLEQEKFRLGSRLVDLLQRLDLRASRFRKCVRCENYFYQESKKERLYCSIRCSAAVRQGKYLAGRRRKQKAQRRRQKK